jgi:hypothetical protein
MDVDFINVFPVVTAALGGAAAWGGAHVKIRTMSKDLEAHDARARAMTVSLAKIEEQVKRIEYIEQKLDRALGGSNGS